MRKFRWGGALAVAVVMAAAALLVGHGTRVNADPATVLKFDTMAPVSGPYVGTANPIRGVSGGGLPWMLNGAMGRLDANGHLVVHVRGLVLADMAPVPENLQGTNPIPDFKAIVSCQTISGGQAVVENMTTAAFPASKGGDSNINASVMLPKPCIAPVIFVTSPGGAWFSATGQ